MLTPGVLLLKLTLAPALVGGASLVGRRFGPRVSGWLIGFPVVAGPVLWFYTQEQGPAFAAHAATATLLGLLSLCLFVLIYAFSACRLSWLPSMLLGWVGFAVGSLAIDRIPVLGQASWPVGLALAAGAFAVTLRCLPRLPEAPSVSLPPPNLPLRLVATALLVVTLTGLARVLGPGLSGLFTPFPIATSVLVVFAHREAGPSGVVAVLAGFIPSLYSFACFCAALAFALLRWPPALAFTMALLVTLVCQTAVLKVVSARQPRSVSAS